MRPVQGFSPSVDVAQLAEQGFRKAQVVGSKLTVGSNVCTHAAHGLRRIARIRPLIAGTRHRLWTDIAAVISQLKLGSFTEESAAQTINQGAMDASDATSLSVIPSATQG